MQSSDDTEKILPRTTLTKCIQNVAEDLGLTEGEFKEYS